MSIRSNRSTTNLNVAVEEDEGEVFLETNNPSFVKSANIPDSQNMNGSKKATSSTVLDLGFDYWESPRTQNSVIGNLVTGNSGPYKPPISYRMGNSKININRHLATAIIVITFAIFFLSYFAYFRTPTRSVHIFDHDRFDPGDKTAKTSGRTKVYNITYPLSNPFFISQGVLKYKIALIADLDTDSKVANKSNTWKSLYKRGSFIWDTSSKNQPTFEWNDEVEIKGTLSMGGRGMELSELIVFDGKLLTVDDRTGIIYWVHLEKNKPVRLSPWLILSDGNGEETKGFKCEWATVKDNHLYVGGLGKEWTTNEGVVLNFNPMWVKKISITGEIENIDWHDNYIKMRSSAGIEFPGYMIHEAITWSDIHKQWFALPRRASINKYNDVDDERHGTNFMLRANEDFSGKVLVSRVTELGEPATHGFSSFKFVPGTQDTVIIALKSEEYKGTIASYVLVFNIDGTILYPETKIGDHKYEGIEFV